MSVPWQQQQQQQECTSGQASVRKQREGEECVRASRCECACVPADHWPKHNNELLLWCGKEKERERERERERCPGAQKERASSKSTSQSSTTTTTCSTKVSLGGVRVGVSERVKKKNLL